MKTRELMGGAALGVAVVAMVIMMTPGSAEAQLHLCGDECQDCSSPDTKQAKFDVPNFKEGHCHVATECQDCPEVLVAENARPEREFVRVLVASSAGELGAVLGDYRERVLVHATRNLVAVRGSGCSPDKITTVMFLERPKIEALVALGVAELEGFLGKLELTATE